MTKSKRTSRNNLVAALAAAIAASFAAALPLAAASSLLGATAPSAPSDGMRNGTNARIAVRLADATRFRATRPTTPSGALDRPIRAYGISVPTSAPDGPGSYVTFDPRAAGNVSAVNDATVTPPISAFFEHNDYTRNYYLNSDTDSAVVDTSSGVSSELPAWSPDAGFSWVGMYANGGPYGLACDGAGNCNFYGANDSGGSAFSFVSVSGVPDLVQGAVYSDSDDSGLYCYAISAADGALIRIDVYGQTWAAIGPTGIVPLPGHHAGFAYDRASGVVYLHAVTDVAGTPTAEIYSVDVSTGALAPVAQPSPGTELAAFSIQSNSIDGESLLASGFDTNYQLDNGQNYINFIWSYFDNSLGVVVLVPAVYINEYAVNAENSPYTLDHVQLYFADQSDNGGASPIGFQGNLLVYYDADADGDPSNATKIYDEPFTISTDGFNDYSVDIDIPGPGNIYVGYTDTWSNSSSNYFSANTSQDLTIVDNIGSFSGSHYKSWQISDYSFNPANTDDLSQNDYMSIIGDGGPPGNLMIRAIGHRAMGRLEYLQ